MASNLCRIDNTLCQCMYIAMTKASANVFASLPIASYLLAIKNCFTDSVACACHCSYVATGHIASAQLLSKMK